MKSKIPTDLVGAKEAAGLLGISPKTLRNWTCLRKVPVYKIAGSKFSKYSLAEIEALVVKTDAIA